MSMSGRRSSPVTRVIIIKIIIQVFTEEGLSHSKIFFMRFLYYIIGSSRIELYLIALNSAN